MLREKYGLDLNKVVPKHAMERLMRIVDEIDVPINAGPYVGFYVISRVETRIEMYQFFRSKLLPRCSR